MESSEAPPSIRLQQALDQLRSTRAYTLEMLADLQPQDWFAMPGGVTHIACKSGIWRWHSIACASIAFAANVNPTADSSRWPCSRFSAKAPRPTPTAENIRRSRRFARPAGEFTRPRSTNARVWKMPTSIDRRSSRIGYSIPNWGRCFGVRAMKWCMPARSRSFAGCSAASRFGSVRTIPQEAAAVAPGACRLAPVIPSAPPNALRDRCDRPRLPLPHRRRSLLSPDRS